MVHITSPTFTMQVCICPYLMLCRYYVNRDTLFCYHKASEAFLQRLMALYVASHYKVIVDWSPLTLIYLFHSPPPPFKSNGSAVPCTVLSFLWLIFLSPEFPKWPADVVWRSGSSPLLPPATCSSHTKLTTWGPCCGAGTVIHSQTHCFKS